MTNTNKVYIVATAVVLLLAGVFSFSPNEAKAFDFECLVIPFNCDSDPAPRNRTVNNVNTYTNSNNVNSNINSPNSTVIDGNASTPVYAYDYPTYPNYPQYPQYPNYPSSPLSITCYPQPLSAEVGETVRWIANVYGGSGSSYNISWTGTDGLSGYGSAVSRTYYNSGYKNASVTVTSGNQTSSRNCDATVYISGGTYHQPPYYPPQPPYYPVYNNLSVSCSVNPSYTYAGNSVTWTAYASGGTGYYTYSWSGTDGLYGSGQSIYFRYNNPGYKYGTVTVYSGGQSITKSCNNSVNVAAYQYPVYPTYPTYPTPIYPVYNQGDLSITCYADPSSIRVNQPTTWTATVTGGYGPYTYNWSGTDNLTGNQSSVIKYYAKSGSKYALVSITSADGRTTSRACSHSVTVRSNVKKVAPQPPVQPVQPPPPPYQPGTDLGAASIFSLENVPWGWIAILVILILFATVLYLMFNRKNI